MFRPPAKFIPEVPHPPPSGLADLPQPSLQQVGHFVSDFREAVEPFWDDDTVSSNYLELTPRYRSEGQCAPTTMLLFDEFRRTFPQCNIHIAIGSVLPIELKWGEGVLLPGHAWLRLLQNGETFGNRPKLAYVIDATADQLNRRPFVGRNRATVMSELELIKNGLYYQIERIEKEPVDIWPHIRPTTLERTKILRQRSAERLDDLHERWVARREWLGKTCRLDSPWQL